jgi:hypothetical protein
MNEFNTVDAPFEYVGPVDPMYDLQCESCQ